MSAGYRFQTVSDDQADLLVGLLHDAEEDDERIRQALADPLCQSYLAYEGSAAVGAAVVRWAQTEAEIVYIAVADFRRGQGHGRRMVEWIQREAARRGSPLVVGTANSSLDNIAFYQRCGFRMTGVNRDFFDYIHPPISENGIAMRDMIVFGYGGDSR